MTTTERQVARIAKGLAPYKAELLPGSIETMARRDPGLADRPDLHAEIARRLRPPSEPRPSLDGKRMVPPGPTEGIWTRYINPEHPGYKLPDGRPMHPLRAMLARFASAGTIRPESVDKLFAEWSQGMADASPDDLAGTIEAKLARRENWAHLVVTPELPAGERVALDVLRANFPEMTESARGMLARTESHRAYDPADLVRTVANLLANPTMAAQLAGGQRIESGDWRLRAPATAFAKPVVSSPSDDQPGPRASQQATVVAEPRKLSRF